MKSFVNKRLDPEAPFAGKHMHVDKVSLLIISEVVNVLYFQFQGETFEISCFSNSGARKKYTMLIITTCLQLGAAKNHFIDPSSKNKSPALKFQGRIMVEVRNDVYIYLLIYGLP